MSGTRVFFIFAAAFTCVIAVGFIVDHPLAMSLWPWEVGPLARYFLGSILLAVAAPVGLIGFREDYAAARGGALNLMVMFGIMAAYSLTQQLQSAVFVWFGVVTAAFAIIQLGIYVWARQFAAEDWRRTPLALRLCFALYALILIAVGAALLAGRPNVLPWPVDTKFAPLYAAIYLGASIYFLYGIAHPIWSNARGQLVGFLAYDVVLIVPFLRHFDSVAEPMWLSLVVYLGVVIFSGVISFAYLATGPEHASIDD